MANGAVNPGSNAKGMGTAGSSVGKNVGGRLPRRRLTKRAANALAIYCATTPPSPTPKMRPQALQSPAAPMSPKNMAAIYSLENFVA